MSQNSQPIPRRHHKKSFSGCRSCKLRKVKCDETRPLCKNCAKHFVNIEKCCFDPVNPRGSGAKNATKVSVQVEPCPAHSVALINSKKGLVEPMAEPMQLAPSKRTIFASIASSRSRHKSLSRWHEHTPVPVAISADQMDPFNSHPETKSLDVDVLLGHYLSTFVLRNFLYFTTNPMVKLWWPLIQSDGLLYHVTLLISSLSLEEISSRRERNCSRYLLGRRNSWILQAECILQLRERVRDQVLGTSDQTIVAVANLAAIEHERGNIKMVHMHMNGLRRMVSMRGGLNTIRVTSPLAANIAFWMSMVAMNEPRFLPAEFIGFETAYDTTNYYSSEMGLAGSLPRLSIQDSNVSDIATPFCSFSPKGTPRKFVNVNTLPDYSFNVATQHCLQTVTPNDTYLASCDPSDLSDSQGSKEAGNEIPSTEFYSTSDLLPMPSTCSSGDNIRSTSSSTSPVDFTTFGISASFAHLLRATQQISQYFSTIVDYTSSSEDISKDSSSHNTISVFGEVCFLVQRLLRLPAADCVSESCRFAAAIQLISPLWGYYPDCTLVVNALLHQLMASLKQLLASNAELRIMDASAISGTAAAGGGSSGDTLALPLLSSSPPSAWFSNTATDEQYPKSPFPLPSSSNNTSTSRTTEIDTSMNDTNNPYSITTGTLAMGMTVYLQVWLFTVGAAQADKCTPEHDWFVDHLVVVVTDLNLKDWTQMRNVLVRFVWHDLFCEGPFRDVWEEVMERGEVVKGLGREERSDEDEGK